MTGLGKLIKARAIDLYSGVGGWSLGLRLAGIDVIASYEHWGPANETNFKNNLHQAQTVDIRRLALEELPSDIDVVVGSPPCTQFSYSNRGGSGNIEDGLVDIVRFLTIVDHLKPRVWAMENVPRVAPILEQELKEGGCLHRFAHLGLRAHLVNMEDFGVPQRRRRCIAGNFDFGLLETYAPRHPPTLGSVVKALSSDPVVDPIYGIAIPQDELFDHDMEGALNEEEVRINRASKTLHPVYNSMPFPDPLDRTVRTITATCTRVSRESIIVEQPGEKDFFRRLSIRERATLQGFPITFQFYGANYGQKLRMVGNAIPPVFSYLVAQSFLGTSEPDVLPIGKAALGLTSPTPRPDVTLVDTAGSKYPENRTFRFAIPSLRLKSGVRFELTNIGKTSEREWRVAFWFGTSKDIRSLMLTPDVAKRVMQALPIDARRELAMPLAALEAMLETADLQNMQKLWSHRRPGRTRPFMLLDELDSAGTRIQSVLTPFTESMPHIVRCVVTAQYGDSTDELPGLAKLDRNATLILSGVIVGFIANAYLAKIKSNIDPSGASRTISTRA